MSADTQKLTHQRQALSITSYGDVDMAKALDIALPNGSATALSHDDKGMIITDSRTVIPNRTSADDPWKPLQHGDGGDVAFHVMGWLDRLPDDKKRRMCLTRPLNPSDAPQLIGWRLILSHEFVDGEPCKYVHITPDWYS